jgi:putative membrane protein
MNPTLRAFLISWDLRFEILLPLLVAGALYARGWRRLRRRGSQRLATRWRLAAFLGGLFTIVLSLLSAIDSFSADLANPFPFLLWGLPRGRELGLALFAPGARFAQLLRKATGPGITWLLFVACIWGWHDPGAYDAALKSDLVHDIEHLSFYLTALLFWWHVTQSGPRVHRSLSPGARIAYTLSVVPANMIAGVAISFAGEPLYEHYLTVPRLWGLTALQDQQLGGTIMWIPGSMMYLLATIALIAAWMQQEEQRAATT